MGREIKPYEEVKVGDQAYTNPDSGSSDYLGEVMWKGTYEELKESDYSGLEDDWEDLEVDHVNYDLIVIWEIGFGSILFNYNGDPSGCVVYKKDKP